MIDTLPRPRPCVIFKAMDDGAVLYCTESEIYFGVNAVGVVIWNALAAAEVASEDLVEAVCEAFPDAPASEVPADVEDFLAELHGAGLLEEASAAASPS
jgi:hypothetical protein